MLDTKATGHASTEKVTPAVVAQLQMNGTCCRGFLLDVQACAVAKHLLALWLQVPMYL